MPTQSVRIIGKIALGLVAFIPAARTLATMPSQVIDKFVQGHVVLVNQNQLVVETKTRGEFIIQISPQTELLDRRFVQDIPIATNDAILAWIAPRGDRFGEAEKLWVNWVHLEGQVTNLSATQCELHSTDASVTIVLDPRTVLSNRTQRATIAENILSLKEGERIVVSGRRVANGSVIAVDISPSEN